MDILVKIPSRERGAKWFERYLMYSKRPNTRFLISLDDDDHKTIEAFNAYKDRPNVKIVIGKSKNKIDAVNRDLENEPFDVLVVGSDDMQPQIKGYDSIIEANFRETTDRYLWTFDGHQKKICTLPIMGRQYYDRFGYVYHNSYLSFFCDDEQTWIAKHFKKCVRLQQCLFLHNHPAWNSKTALPYDRLYRINTKNWKVDHNNFLKRKKINFGI